MSFFRSESGPMVAQGTSPPPIPSAPPSPPTFGVNMFSSRRQSGIGLGYGSTILTSGGGLTTPASTAKKTLLGG